MMNDLPPKEEKKITQKTHDRCGENIVEKTASRRLASHKFQRQTSINQYIVDFYCAEEKLVVEIDGDVHGFHRQRLLDQKRQHYLESHGFTILRFTNEEVKNSIEGVLRSIIQHLD